MTERDVIKMIPQFFEEAGCYEMSFGPIVASGPNGSMPHYSGDKRVIEKMTSSYLTLGEGTTDIAQTLREHFS